MGKKHEIEPKDIKKKKTKKSKKSKKASAHTRGLSSTAAPMLFFNPAEARGKESDSSESASTSESSESRIRAAGSISVLKLPKERLQDVVHAMADALEPISTAEWTPEDLCRMIWILSRIKPSLTVTQFKVKTYKDLRKAFMNRASIIRAKEGAQTLDAEVRDAIFYDPPKLHARAITYGFKDEWVAPAKKKKPVDRGTLQQHFRMQQVTQIESSSGVGLGLPPEARPGFDLARAYSMVLAKTQDSHVAAGSGGGPPPERSVAAETGGAFAHTTEPSVAAKAGGTRAPPPEPYVAAIAGGPFAPPPEASVAEVAAASLPSDTSNLVAANRAKALARRAKKLALAKQEAAPKAGTLEPTQGDNVRSEAQDDMSRPMCLICSKPLLPAEAVTALPCSHYFHESCIMDWAEVKNLPLDQACPVHGAKPMELVSDAVDDGQSGGEEVQNEADAAALGRAVAEASSAAADAF